MAPGSPATSSKMMLARSASKRKPTDWACCSMALRSSAGSMGGISSWWACISALSAGWKAHSPQKSARMVRTTRASWATASMPVENGLALGGVADQSEKLFELVDDQK